ncbi:MAG: hypothetical protein R2711_14055 [Acidimicrobiales bacterium]
MTERRVLALVAEPGGSARAVPLLGIVGLEAVVVSWQRRDGVVPDAVLAASVGALDLLGDAPDRPTGTWVRHHDEIDVALGRGVDLLLTGRAELVARGAVLVPPLGIEVDRWPPVAPLVRARRREALGLPARHVVRADELEASEELEAALAVASAAVVSGPSALLALALGTPSVTSADTARRLGVRPGRDVEVASGPDAATAIAEELAADPARAAALSRRARRFAERHLDLGRPARVVLERLGLVEVDDGPTERVGRRLDELGTPAGSPVRARAADALAVLAPDGGGSTT